MDIFINQKEYTRLTDEAGVRVVLTDQARMPFPFDEGFSVPTGFSTSVGIKKVIQKIHLIFTFLLIHKREKIFLSICNKEEVHDSAGEYFLSTRRSSRQNCHGKFAKLCVFIMICRVKLPFDLTK